MEAIGLGCGELKVACADGLEEFNGFLLHPVELAIAALMDTSKPDLGWEVDQDGEVGQGRADGKLVDGFDLVSVDGAGDALVDSGRIEEAVAEYDLPRSQGGLDQLADVLGTAGGEEEELCFGRHAVPRVVVLQQVADRLAEGRASGLAGLHDGVARCHETLFQRSDLGRFTATFAAFECDEEGALRADD